MTRNKIDTTADAHQLISTDELGKPAWSEIGSAIHRVALNKGLTLDWDDPVLDLYRHEIEDLDLVKVKVNATTSKRRITLTRRGAAAYERARGWIKRGKVGR